MTFDPKTYLKSSLTRPFKVIELIKVFVHMDCCHNYPQLILSTTPGHLDPNRGTLELLCDLVTGHSRLLTFQYRIHQSYTSTFACLQDNETLQHYLHHCPDYTSISQVTNPTLDQWKNVINFNMLAQWLTFWPTTTQAIQNEHYLQCCQTPTQSRLLNTQLSISI